VLTLKIGMGYSTYVLTLVNTYMYNAEIQRRYTTSTLDINKK